MPLQWLESRRILVIYCFSRLLLPYPADWGPNARIVGPLLPAAPRCVIAPATAQSFSAGACQHSHVGCPGPAIVVLADVPTIGVHLLTVGGFAKYTYLNLHTPRRFT